MDMTLGPFAINTKFEYTLLGIDVAATNQFDGSVVLESIIDQIGYPPHK